MMTAPDADGSTPDGPTPGGPTPEGSIPETDAPQTETPEPDAPEPWWTFLAGRRGGIRDLKRTFWDRPGSQHDPHDTESPDWANREPDPDAP